MPSTGQDIYVGIDVAFAKRKRLPICACTTTGNDIDVLPMRSTFKKPPSGRGNRAALEESQRAEFAEAVLHWLRDLENHLGVRIRRIAIDAPKNFAVSGRRRAECAMDQRGISCFATPTQAEFNKIVTKAKTHLENGGSETDIPHANQLWMLVGFALFRELETAYDCIEVFPQATVREIGCDGDHKSTTRGVGDQIKRYAEVTGQRVSDVERSLEDVGYGSKHDRFDALLSAWVASLPETLRVPLGARPDDVIWIPDLASLTTSLSPRGLAHGTGVLS
jgi:hypothetical protein